MTTDMNMPVVPAYGGGGGFGGSNGWEWIIVLFLFAGGWNRGGYGGGGSGAVDGYVLASDFAQIDNKLDRVTDGICDATFALNNSIKDGFYAAELSRSNGRAELMQTLNTMSMQNAQCCCDMKNLMQTNTRDIIDNQNCNTRAILDYMTKRDYDCLKEQYNELKLAVSQNRQNDYLLARLLPPAPIPAYSVPNPNCCNTGCGYGVCA